MCDLKSDGGLTKGRGLASVQRNLFIFSSPLCAEVMDALQKLSSCSFAITVGSNILSDMLTKSVADYHFKTSLQAVNLVQQIPISDKDGSVSVVPKLLFQRLTAILLGGKNNDFLFIVCMHIQHC